MFVTLGIFSQSDIVLLLHHHCASRIKRIFKLSSVELSKINSSNTITQTLTHNLNLVKTNTTTSVYKTGKMYNYTKRPWASDAQQESAVVVPESANSAAATLNLLLLHIFWDDQEVSHQSVFNHLYLVRYNTNVQNVKPWPSNNKKA